MTKISTDIMVIIKTLKLLQHTQSSNAYKQRAASFSCSLLCRFFSSRTQCCRACCGRKRYCTWRSFHCVYPTESKLNDDRNTISSPFPLVFFVASPPNRFKIAVNETKQLKFIWMRRQAHPSASFVVEDAVNRMHLWSAANFQWGQSEWTDAGSCSHTALPGFH